MFENILRWAWGALLTAIVTAVLTMFLKHGKRWFRPVQKFIRTGRIGTTRRSLDGRGRMPAHVAVQGAKEPRMTLARVLTALAQLTGNRPSMPQQNSAPTQSNDVPLDLKF